MASLLPYTNTCVRPIVPSRHTSGLGTANPSSSLQSFRQTLVPKLVAKLISSCEPRICRIWGCGGGIICVTRTKACAPFLGSRLFLFNHVRVFVSFRPLERSRPSHVDEIACIHLTMSMYLRVMLPSPCFAE